MGTFNIVALALLGGQLATAGWMGIASCDTGPFLPRESRVRSSSGCATEFWTEYSFHEYDVDSGEWRDVVYPVLVQQEMSFHTNGFSISVHQRNKPQYDEITRPESYRMLPFSALSAQLLEVVRIYGPGVPGLMEVDWRHDCSVCEYEFHTVTRLDGNELLVWAMLDVDSGRQGSPYPQNQDLKIWIESIRLFDQRTGAPLTGYYYTAGPEPGVMVGGTLWTPEPATFGLMACALFALALRRRRVGC